MADVPMLEMKGITKRFPGVLANDKVDFDLRAGEVHTLLGENGAGKSTLMKILYGLYQADEGEILLNGEPVHIPSPTSAIEHNSFRPRVRTSSARTRAAIAAGTRYLRLRSGIGPPRANG